MLYNYSEYGNDLQMTLEDARSVSHPGECWYDVEALSEVPYIAKQLAMMDPGSLRKELDEYGAWDDEELSDHQSNLHRWVWISGGNISEEFNGEYHETRTKRK